MIKATIHAYLVSGVTLIALASTVWIQSRAITPSDVHSLVTTLQGDVTEVRSNQVAFDVLASAGWAIIIARKDGHRITHWQGAASDLFGYTAAEALSLTVEDLMNSEIRASSEPGHSHVINCRDALHKDGQLFHAALIVSVSRDEKHIVALFRPMER